MNTFLLEAPINTIFKMQVVSDSMSPFLRIGDWVVVRKNHIFEVQEGDVIAFVSPNLDLDSPIVHRVVAKTGTERIVLRTKGDNVDLIDSQKITTANYIGVVIKKESRLRTFFQKFFL